jgi:acyl-CoA thioesterase-1
MHKITPRKALTMKKLYVPMICCLWVSTGMSAAAIKVSCIGNSITAGATSYPATVQTLLGAQYSVENDGVSGTTLLKHGDSPYWQNGKLDQVFAFNPDIITIKLGTNDSKPQNWVYSSEYVTDYNALIDTLGNLPSHPKIFLVLPCPAFSTAFGIRGDTIEQSVIPKILQVANARGLAIIDAHAPMLNFPQYFPDGVHPNSVGSDSIGHIVFRKLIAKPMMKLSGTSMEFRRFTDAGTLPPPKTIIVTNLARSTTLDSVHVTSSALWIKTAIVFARQDSQVVTVTLDSAHLPAVEGMFCDTLAFTANNAYPSKDKCIVTLWVRKTPVLTSFRLVPDTIIVAPNGTMVFSVFARDQYDSLFASAVTWMAPGAAISNTGIFTAPPSVGIFKVTALSGTFSATSAAIVAPGFTSLPSGYIKQMLVALNDNTNLPYVPRGNLDISTDMLGNEATVAPLDGVKATVNNVKCTWKTSSCADGMWADSTVFDQFVAYGALYIYTPASRTVYAHYVCDDALMVRVNGRVVINSGGAGPTKELVSAPIKLPKGLSNFLFKLAEGTGDNFFAVRLTDSTGINRPDLYYQFTNVAPTLPGDAVGVQHLAQTGPHTAPVVRVLRATIRVTTPFAGEQRIALHTLDGKLLAMRRQFGAGQVSLPVAAYANDVYLVRITGRGGNIVFKVRLFSR